MASELSDKEGHNRQQDISQDPQQEIISKGDNTQILTFIILIRYIDAIPL